MKKKKYTKFDSAFSNDDLRDKLSELKPLAAYSFTKKDNPDELKNLLTLLPAGYVKKQEENIELIDLVYSGTTESPFLLTIAVGRNDTNQGKETFDIDVLNIAPETENVNSYFSQLWHHFKDEKGERVSYEISPFVITEQETRKDVTYSVFLTGNTSYYNFDEYKKEKPDFFNIHDKSFNDLKR